jgi:hypothetical protein
MTLWNRRLMMKTVIGQWPGSRGLQRAGHESMHRQTGI